jgi:hypothetical protein
VLYCFEWLSGLKINYHKSEVIFFGIAHVEKERKANMMNCKLGGLPVKYLGISELPVNYLGIPVSDRVIGSSC